MDTFIPPADLLISIAFQAISENIQDGGKLLLEMDESR